MDIKRQIEKQKGLIKEKKRLVEAFSGTIKLLQDASIAKKWVVKTKDYLDDIARLNQGVKRLESRL